MGTAEHFDNHQRVAVYCLFGDSADGCRLHRNRPARPNRHARSLDWPHGTPSPDAGVQDYKLGLGNNTFFVANNLFRVVDHQFQPSPLDESICQVCARPSRVRWQLAAEFTVGPAIHAEAEQEGLFMRLSTHRPIAIPEPIRRWHGG